MFNSITKKLIILILAAILPALLFASYFSYRYSQKMIMSNTQEKAELVMDNAEYRINMLILPVQKIPATIALNMPDTQKALESLLMRNLSGNKDVYGIAASFEPYKFISSKARYSPYVYYKNGEVTLTHLDTDEYNYPEADWYKIPQQKKKPLWSEPYFDEGGGNKLMSTYSYPVLHNGDFMGVVTADISLDELKKIVEGIKVLSSGYAFLVSPDGKIMAHPDKHIVMKRKISDIHASGGMAADIMRSESGSGSYNINGTDEIVWFKTLNATGWKLCLVYPRSEMMAPVRNLNIILLLITVISSVFILTAVSVISRKVTGGMNALARSSEKIASGDLETPLKVIARKDELGRLSQSLETMRGSLVQYISDLTATENEKQKIESELSIAREIQMGILPKIFPPFPHRNDIDIYARMNPAKEVGGDLYDFYFLDDDLLCFLIGDVSGKGVPASLFMAVSKTLIKAVADKNISAGEIFTRVNRELADGNDSCMFVTTFMGILNVATGELTYANAGHNPPAILSGGQVSYIHNKINPPLGAFPQAKYDTYKTVLTENCRMFLYTDGVTEAMDTKGRLFSENRLTEALSALQDKGPREIVEAVSKTLEEYTINASQSDDITMLCLRRKA